MSNKGLLTIVIVILLGIFGVMLIEANEETPGEQIASDIGEVTEELGDKINDATTNSN